VRSVLLAASLMCCLEPVQAQSSVLRAQQGSHPVHSTSDALVNRRHFGVVKPFSSPKHLFAPDIQNSLVYAFVILLVTLGSSAIGFQLQRSKPFLSLTDDHRSASRAALGLATILTAVVIGIVTDDAISTFDQANANIQGLAVDAISLDKVLDSYGPDAALIRRQLRDDLRLRISEIQSGDEFAMADQQAVEGLPRIELIFRNIVALQPNDAAQKELRSRAISMIGGTSSFAVRGNMAQKRWLFTVGDANAPRPIYILVIISLGLEFLCFGLLTKPHRITYLSTALAALVVSVTMLVVVELDNPTDGFFTVWVEPLQKAELLMNR
jgi:hypothetical protein